MPKQVAQSVLDAELNAIKNSATRVMLIKNYAAGDSYTTVTGNAVATATITSADFTLGSGTSNARTLTFGGKSATATSAALAAGNGQDHHIAFTDGSATVLWVTDETAELANAINDTINIPSVVYTANQPT
jgi:hypothetical protein